jgi:hypothetical protein
MKQVKRNIKKKYDDDHTKKNISFYKNMKKLQNTLNMNDAKVKKMMNTIKK